MTASTQGFPASRSRGAILRFALVGLAVVTVGMFLAWFFTCPCDRIPGGYLFGKVIEKPVNDWSFANQVSLCQIQVDAITDVAGVPYDSLRDLKNVQQLAQLDNANAVILTGKPGLNIQTIALP